MVTVVTDAFQTLSSSRTSAPTASQHWAGGGGGWDVAAAASVSKPTVPEDVARAVKNAWGATAGAGAGAGARRKPKPAARASAQASAPEPFDTHRYGLLNLGWDIDPRLTKLHERRAKVVVAPLGLPRERRGSRQPLTGRRSLPSPGSHPLTRALGREIVAAQSERRSEHVEGRGGRRRRRVPAAVQSGRWRGGLRGRLGRRRRHTCIRTCGEWIVRRIRRVRERLRLHRRRRRLHRRCRRGRLRAAAVAAGGAGGGAGDVGAGRAEWRRKRR